MALLATAGGPFGAACGAPAEPAVEPVVSVSTEAGDLPNIAAERRVIDLPTVLRLAQEQNLAIARAQEAVAEERAVRRGAVAQGLPSIGFSAGLARLSPNIATVAGIPTGRLTLSLSPGRVYFDAQAAKFAVRAAEARRESVEQDILLDATARYYNLQLAQGLVRVGELSVIQAQELVRQTEERRQGGLALSADVLRARARLSEEQQALSDARREFKAASIGLAVLLHLPPTVTLVSADAEVSVATLVPPGQPMERLIETALAQRPELGEAAADERGAEARGKSATWGALLPVIGVEQWLGRVTTDTPQSSRRTWVYAEWQLLGGLGQTARSRSDQARSQQRQEGLRREQLREEIAGEVLVAREAVTTAREQTHTAQQQVAAAEASLAVYSERYASGLGLQLDVLGGQEAVTRARQSLVRAVVGYNLAQAELLTRTGGRLSPTDAPAASEK